MSTDYEFNQFVAKRLGSKTFSELFSVPTYLYESPTFLLLISKQKLSIDVLILVEEFLDGLSTEEASKYVDTGNIFGRSVLFCDSVDLIKIIIKYSPNINVYDCAQNDLLICQCNSDFNLSNVEVIKFLLDHGANVNYSNNYHMTALMVCCSAINRIIDAQTMSRIAEIVELLIFCGANVLLKSASGYKAYGYVPNKDLLSEKLSQLLQGEIKLNRTKNASNVVTKQGMLSMS